MGEPSQAVVAYVSAGSNIAPRRHLEAAIVMLRDKVCVLAVSTVFRTAAIGRPDDPDFLNCVIQIKTGIPARALKFDVLGGIEKRLGRQRSPDKYAPRRIDLDLILYGDRAIEEPDLVIPHPDLSRGFVRAALLELSPPVVVPGRTGPGDLGAADAKANRGTPLPEFTRLLRRRLQE
jgi:2-amino-4-hydroxy-6-hydroxymethyldihydropteridine diphosphokinase